MITLRNLIKQKLFTINCFGQKTISRTRTEHFHELFFVLRLL